MFVNVYKGLLAAWQCFLWLFSVVLSLQSPLHRRCSPNQVWQMLSTCVFFSLVYSVTCIMYVRFVLVVSLCVSYEMQSVRFHSCQSCSLQSLSKLTVVTPSWRTMRNATPVPWRPVLMIPAVIKIPVNWKQVLFAGAPSCYCLRTSIFCFICLKWPITNSAPCSRVVNLRHNWKSCAT